jgi:two-component system response regulator YesN
MKTRRLTYLNKLMLYGVVLGIAPLLVLGFFSYFQSSSTIQNYVEEGNLQILKQSQFRIEQNLKTVETSIVSLINSLFVENVLSLPLDGKHFNEFTQLTGSFRQLQVFELGVNDIAFYNMKQNWKVNNSGITTIEENMKPGEFNPYAEIPHKAVWESSDKGVRIITKSPVYDPNPNFVSMAEIPTAHLNSLLLSTSRLGSVIVLDGGMKLLAYQDEEFAGDFLLQTEVAKQLQLIDQPSGQISTHYNDQDYAITYIRSGYNGWIYLSAVSIDVITHDSKAIGQITFWICTVIVLLVLLVSVFSSNRFYRPIRKLYASVVGSESHSWPDLSAREDELQQIGQRFLSLMGREREMSGQIQGHLMLLNQFFVQKLVFGEVRQREIQEKLSDLEYPLTWNRMKVMAIEFDSLEGSRYEEKDRDLLLFAISNMLSELIPETMKLTPIVHNECQATILGADTGDEREWNDHVYTMAESIQLAVRTYLGVTVSVGMSKDFVEWAEVPRAYKEANDALRYRVRLGNEAIIHIHDVLADTKAETSFPVKLMEELKQAVKGADPQQATILLHQMVQTLVKQPAHFHDYQFSFLRFLSELGSLLQDQGISIRTLAKGEESLVDSLFKLRTAEEIEAWFKDVVIEPVLALLEERSASQFENISASVIKMIHEGYDTDLTLESCADRIDYHPHYVSKVFRQETGSTFGDYLLQYRLGIAKLWLQETDMKISDISEKLKYTNPTNFIRSFRKVEGMTPGQYRERMYEIRVPGGR